MLKTITFLFSSNFLLFIILLHVICEYNMTFQKCHDIFAASNNAFNKLFTLEVIVNNFKSLAEVQITILMGIL